MEQLNLIPTLWQQICNFDNIYLAWSKARKGKSNRPDVARFTLALEQECFAILDDLLSLTYRPGAYRAFHIYENKPRVISVAPFRDRVVHHALMNILEPVFEQKFIQESFACRKGKGVHAAVDYYQRQSRRFAYVLKMDVQKYFPSIRHDLLKEQVTKTIRGSEPVTILHRIIDECNTLEYTGRGLPIGNLTSQILANLYLNGFDHGLASNSDIAYLRYVDDLFLLGNDKSRLWQLHTLSQEYLGNLGLRLHQNKSHIFRTSEKVDVLGYKVTPYKRWLRNENGYRMRRKLRRLSTQYCKGDITLADARASMMSWKGHAQHGETRSLVDLMFQETSFCRRE